jgi:DNA-binding transcriptional ArsR family regulator
MAGSKDGGECPDREDRYRRAAIEHPLREEILRLLLDGRQAGAAEIAADLGEALGRILYHLRVLVRRGALKVVPKCRPAPPLYRWSPEARWARKMLGEDKA